MLDVTIVIIVVSVWCARDLLERLESQERKVPEDLQVRVACQANVEPQEVR